ncbi:MAG TPA: FAD-binding oxidoreductase [Actinomycetota bacterium]|jgi:glycine/D-amino acid oxidase-like deaminating enzyme
MPDVVIIGGGVIGAACASELARGGAHVALLERDELAAHASGRNQGLWVLPEDDATVPMAMRSLERYLVLAPDAPIDIQLDPEPIGLVMVARGDDELAAARHAAGVAERAGTRVDALDDAQLAELEPALSPALAGAWLVHHGHRLDPGALTVAMALEAHERGAEIRHHTNARALALRGDRVVGAITDDGLLEADVTIVAGGPWSSRLLDPVGVSLPVVGARGWLVRVAPPPGLVRHLVEEVAAHVALRQGHPSGLPTAGEVAGQGFPADVLGTIMHPHRDGTVLIGSSRQTWLTPEPDDATVVRRLLAAAIELAPALADATVRSSWWGIRPLSPDERPFVGQLRDGLFVATGHGSEGVILGAGTAELLGTQIAGDDAPFDPAPFDPLRFSAG